MPAHVIPSLLIVVAENLPPGLPDPDGAAGVAFGLSTEALVALIVLCWLVVVNVVAFFATGLDKWKAKRKENRPQVSRIRERTLFLIGALGGVWGMMLGMRTFRHKTRKRSFKLVTALLVLLNIAYFAAAIYWLINNA